MGGRRRFQQWFAIGVGNGAAVPVEQADSQVFVETEPVGYFFLESLGNTFSHGGSNAGALQCCRSMQNAAQTHDFIQSPLRYFALAHFRKGKVTAIAGKERDDICVVIEART